MFYSCVQLPVTVEINMPATKRSSESQQVARKHSVMHKKATCACLLFPVAARCSEAQERKGDLWSVLNPLT